jgi:hypothetical protein
MDVGAAIEKAEQEARMYGGKPNYVFKGFCKEHPNSPTGCTETWETAVPGVLKAVYQCGYGKQSHKETIPLLFTFKGDTGLELILGDKHFLDKSGRYILVERNDKGRLEASYIAKDRNGMVESPLENFDLCVKLIGPAYGKFLKQSQQPKPCSRDYDYKRLFRFIDPSEYWWENKFKSLKKEVDEFEKKVQQEKL